MYFKGCFKLPAPKGHDTFVHQHCLWPKGEATALSSAISNIYRHIFHFDPNLNFTFISNKISTSPPLAKSTAGIWPLWWVGILPPPTSSGRWEKCNDQKSHRLWDRKRAASSSSHTHLSQFVIPSFPKKKDFLILICRNGGAAWRTVHPIPSHPIPAVTHCWCHCFPQAMHRQGTGHLPWGYMEERESEEGKKEKGAILKCYFSPLCCPRALRAMCTYNPRGGPCTHARCRCSKHMGCAAPRHSGALAAGSNAAEPYWSCVPCCTARIIALSCIPCSLTAPCTGEPQEGPQEQTDIYI